MAYTPNEISARLDDHAQRIAALEARAATPTTVTVADAIESEEATNTDSTTGDTPGKEEE